MTLPVAVLDEHRNVTWTICCTWHSEPDHGVHICVCSATMPDRVTCPCEAGDRYVIVEAVRADRRWQECADVLVCALQPGWSAARRATYLAMGQLPGCILAVAFLVPSGCVLRNRKGTVIQIRHRVVPKLLAAYAHLDQRRDHAV